MPGPFDPLPGFAPRAAGRRAALVFGIGLWAAACAPGDLAGMLGAAPVRVADAGSRFVVAEGKPGESRLGNYLAGRHAQARRDLPAAADFFGAVLDKDPDNPEMLLTAIMLLVEEGRVDKASPLARRLLAIDRRAAAAHLVLAADDFKAGRFAVAEQRLGGLPETGVNAFVMPLMRAWALVGSGKPDAALEALRPLARTTGAQAIYNLHAALVNELAGRAEAAEESYLKAAADGNGLSLRLVELLGAFYERTGRAEKAEALYKKYLDEQPNSRLLRPGLARRDSGGLAGLTVTSAVHGAAEALFGVANSLRQQTSRDNGLFFGQLALHLRPNFPLAQIMVADLFEADKRLERAIAVYNAVDPASPFAWPARLRVAAGLDKLDRTDEAAGKLNALAREFPGQPEPLISLGDILRGRERFVDAVKAYDAAAARIQNWEPRHWSLLYARGIALERSKQWPRAEADFLKALDFEPDQPYVLNYLGYSWVDQGLNLARARKMIERAVELRPQDGYIVDSLGWVLYRLNDFASATRELERAVELRPEDPVINDHLGDAYWKVGRRPEAYFQWRRALTLKPEADLLGQIELKLKQGLVEDPAKAKSGRDG